MSFEDFDQDPTAKHAFADEQAERRRAYWEVIGKAKAAIEEGLWV